MVVERVHRDAVGGHALSTSTRRTWLLPALVMPPRRVLSELEFSLGMSPRFCRGVWKRSTPCNSVTNVIAVIVSMPWKHRSHPAGSR